MPFDPRAITTPFRMQPGLRRVAPGTAALHAAPPGSAAFEAKLAVLSRGAAHATAHCLVGLPGAGLIAALRLVAETAQQCCPAALQWRAGRLLSPALGLACSPEGDLAPSDEDSNTACPPHPGAWAVLRALPATQRAAGLASLSLQEDLALIDAATASLPWMAVCLPSHWDPAEKVGRDFRSVHAPVADNHRVHAAGPQLLALVSAGQAWERFVWTLTPWPGLDQHPLRHERRPWPQHCSADALLDLAVLRTERQGFLPLAAASGSVNGDGRPVRQAVFTIEVQARPLRQALGEEFAPATVTPGHLADALASMSDAVLAYRSLTPARDRLVAGLRALQASAAPGRHETAA
ncbi:MAG: hypothetical protein RIQ60_4290 [Pseudomonadota bacterium]|jgi:hypothetical protein